MDNIKCKLDSRPLQERFQEMIKTNPVKILRTAAHPYIEDNWALARIDNNDNGKNYCGDCPLWPCEETMLKMIGSAIKGWTFEVYRIDQNKDAEAAWELFDSQKLMNDMTK